MVDLLAPLKAAIEWFFDKIVEGLLEIPMIFIEVGLDTMLFMPAPHRSDCGSGPGVNSAIWGDVGGLCAELRSAWADMVPLYFGLLTVATLVFLIIMQLFPHSQKADPYRFGERAFASIILLAISKQLMGRAIELHNIVGSYIMPTSGTLTPEIGGLEDAAGTIFAIAALLIFADTGLILTILAFMAMLAMRILLIYTVFALFPLLLAMWTVDVGPAKYGNMVAEMMFKLTAVLLIFGIIIAGILKVGGTITDAEGSGLAFTLFKFFTFLGSLWLVLALGGALLGMTISMPGGGGGGKGPRVGGGGGSASSSGGGAAAGSGAAAGGAYGSQSAGGASPAGGGGSDEGGGFGTFGSDGTPEPDNPDADGMMGADSGGEFEDPEVATGADVGDQQTLQEGSADGVSATSGLKGAAGSAAKSAGSAAKSAGSAAKSGAKTAGKMFNEQDPLRSAGIGASAAANSGAAQKAGSAASSAAGSAKNAAKSAAHDPVGTASSAKDSIGSAAGSAKSAATDPKGTAASAKDAAGDKWSNFKQSQSGHDTEAPEGVQQARADSPDPEADYEQSSLVDQNDVPQAQNDKVRPNSQFDSRDQKARDAASDNAQTGLGKYQSEPDMSNRSDAVSQRPDIVGGSGNAGANTSLDDFG